MGIGCAYSKRAPAPDGAIGSHGKRGAITCANLSEDNALWEMLRVNSCRCAFTWVHGILVIGIRAAIALVVIHVLKTTLPLRVAAQSTLIIDTPSEDLVVVGQGSAVHTTNRNLNDTDLRGGQVLIEARTLDIDRLLVVDSFAAEAKFS